MNKKIILLANDTTYVYNLRLALIKELISKDYEITIIAQILNFKKELEDLGCKIIDMSIGRHGTNPIDDLKLLKNYIKILKKEKPDIVLSYNIKPNIYGGMACRILKINRFMPNVTGLGTALEYPGLMQKITIILYKIGLKKAEVVFFQNSENKKFFEKNNILMKNTKKVLLPGSGVDLDKHKLLVYPKSKVVKFLYIARIMKDKGIDLYLELAKKIKEEYPNTEFHICGYCDDNKYKEILDKYEKDNIIIYHGEQKEMIPFFKMAHCIIHPSYYPEGMSNVLLESAAHGRPIICTNRAGCKEAVDNNKSGFIVPIKNFDKLYKYTKKIIKMSNTDRKTMGINGRKKIEKEFDRSIVVKKYMEEVNNVDSKIHILHVLGKLQMGGAETLVMNLYKNINKDKFVFDFVVHGNEIGEYEKEIIKMGGIIYRVPKYKVYNHFIYKNAWKKLFKAYPKYKVIHCHVRSTASIILKIAKNYGLKTICHSHSTSNGKGISSLVKNFLQKKIIKFADYQLACSKEAAIWLYGNKCFCNSNCIILPNGIDCQKFIFKKEYREEIRNKFLIKNDELLIGHVGRFENVKNHDFIVEIAENIISMNPKIKFLLCGDGSLKDHIIKKINNLSINNNFIFVNSTDEIYKFYNAFDLFILPSKYEGLGISLIEAQYSSLNCIVSLNIPDEAIISDRVIKLELEKNKWIQKILLFNNIYVRKNKLNESAKYYDINYICNILCNIYDKETKVK